MSGADVDRWRRYNERLREGSRRFAADVAAGRISQEELVRLLWHEDPGLVEAIEAALDDVERDRCATMVLGFRLRWLNGRIVDVIDGGWLELDRPATEAYLERVLGVRRDRMHAREVRSALTRTAALLRRHLRQLDDLECGDDR